LILGFAVLQNPLNDSAPIWMSGQNVDLATESFDDELDMLCWNPLDGFLNDVIAILILNAFEDIGLELCN
jgi:hypothetical protein